MPPPAIPSRGRPHCRSQAERHYQRSITAKRPRHSIRTLRTKAGYEKTQDVEDESSEKPKTERGTEERATRPITQTMLLRASCRAATCRAEQPLGAVCGVRSRCERRH